MIESSINQELTEAQSEILSYWGSLEAFEAALPKRGAFDPGAVLRYLRDITVLELTETGRVTCRVASSSLNARFPDDAMSETHTLGLDQILSEHAPVRGCRETSQGTHHWLRLPLLSDCGARMLVLCHDEYVQDRRQQSRDRFTSAHLSTSNVAIAA